MNDIENTFQLKFYGENSILFKEKWIFQERAFKGVYYYV